MQVKSQITNSKGIKFCLFGIWLLVIVCNLCIGNWNFVYAAPCYGTKMPEKHKAFLGLQTHSVFKRYLE
ncbi:MAG: hypothetical protein WC658_04735, partial [Candidatus Omnitrophota bacterium]